MNRKIKQAIRHAELEIKRKDKEKWQALEERIGKQKVEEIQGSLKNLADLYGDYLVSWQNLKNGASKAVYDEWWEENHDKPIQEALEKLELKVRGRKCKAKDCNNVFIPKRSDQFYCSMNCRTRAFHQRKRASSTDKT